MSPVAFIIIVLAAALLVYALIFTKSTTPKSTKSRRAGRIDRGLVEQRWSTISQMAGQGGNGLRTAVSEADKLLDYALKNSGVPGETMGERLKASGRRFSDVDSIWRAHKLRNALAHEVGFDLVPAQAREALADFEKGLKDLGAL